jgi:predicted secreted protein
MRFSTIVLLAAVLFSAGAGQSLSTQTTTIDFTVSERENGGDVNVEVGQQLRVNLPCSPGTGYSWRLIEDPGPQLSLVSSGMTGKDSDMPGSSQTQDFMFTAETVGVKKLRFEYVRPWDDPGKTPAKTYFVTAHVEG